MKYLAISYYLWLQISAFIGYYFTNSGGLLKEVVFFDGSSFLTGFLELHELKRSTSNFELLNF